MKTLYTAEVTAIGGRKGQIKSSDGVLDMEVGIPELVNGSGSATNPEQLFAAGYASCFQSALQLVARKQGTTIEEGSTVKAQVTLLQDEQTHQYALGVNLEVDLKSMDKEKAREMVDEAHEICPYSVGTKGNIEVELHVV